MEENNKSLISLNNSLAKIERQIAIGEKILGIRIPNLDRKKIKELLIFLGDKNNFSINLLSHFYSFNIDTIDKNIYNLNWIFLSSNHNLNWSIQLIEKYKKKWCWNESLEYISYGGQFTHPTEFRFVRSLCTKSISTNESIQWTISDIEQFENYLYWFGFSKTVKLNWTDEIIDKFKFDFHGLSLNNTFICPEHIMNKYFKFSNISFWCLNSNPSVNWDIERIKSNIDKINFTSLLRNEGIDWSYSLLKEVLELYENYLPEEKREDRIKVAWKYFSTNKNFQWSEEFIEKNETKLSWGYHWANPEFSLSNNEGLPWNENFIEKHKEKWSWFYLSKNSKLPWSENFINKYINNWRWDNLSENEGLPWSEKFIDEHIDKWNWKKLSQNPNLPWSLDFFEKYSDKWDLNILLFNKGFYKIFESILDDILVNEIIFEIINKKL